MAKERRLVQAIFGPPVEPDDLIADSAVLDEMARDRAEAERRILARGEVVTALLIEAVIDEIEAEEAAK